GENRGIGELSQRVADVFHRFRLPPLLHTNAPCSLFSVFLFGRQRSGPMGPAGVRVLASGRAIPSIVRQSPTRVFISAFQAL
ncbi:MAG TPA: hypothetical protein VN843_34790, partial [Anaerolineales bacterium]|nr:hypothetical protein [Anaerolineales bacterium]